MSLRYALLGLLAEAPMSGYDLTKRFEHSLGRIWPAKHNQIYTELKALQADELIELTDYGPRGRKIYAITEAGLEDVRSWLLQAPEELDRSMRFGALLRMNFYWLLASEAVDQVLDAEERYYREQADWIQKQMATLPPSGSDASVAARHAVARVGQQLYEAIADSTANLKAELEAIRQTERS